MPIYQYKCEKCGELIEVFEHHYSGQWKMCSCGGTAHKIISHTNFNAVDIRCQREFGHDLAGNWTAERGAYDENKYED